MTPRSRLGRGRGGFYWELPRPDGRKPYVTVFGLASREKGAKPGSNAATAAVVASSQETTKGSYSGWVKTTGYEGYYFDGGGAYCRTVSVNG
jgi:hypothetical protein